MNGRPVSNARWWTLTILVAVAIALGIVSYTDLRDDNRAKTGQVNALADQVRRLGGTPVAGEPGKDGATGRDGRDGTEGADGDDGEPGSPGPTGSPGVAGTRGAVGPTGAAGNKGEAGSVGTPGSPGPTGPAGPSGPAGAQGPAGEKGDTGEPGESVMCPAGYTPTEIVIVPHPGTYTVCKRDDED